MTTTPMQRPDEMLKASRVLILEDEAILAMLLARVLTNMGHSVSATVGSVAGALAAVERSRPDLMIVDARLRDGSGISAVREIIRTGFVPHIFVSGDNCQAHTLGPGSAALEKPYRDTELAQAIQSVLGAVSAGTAGPEGR
jgi:CheY-like chemotaxis protein